MSASQNISDSIASAQLLERRGSAATRASLYLSIPAALLAAAWITAGRALFGAGGDLVPVFAVSLGPALTVMLLVGAVLSYRETALQSQGRRAGMPWLTALVQGSAWGCALVFGMLVPDRIEGQTVSAVSQLWGADLVGLSAGFGNTLGILTFACAVAYLLMSLADLRCARAAAAGIDDDVRERLEREESMYDFLD